LKEEIWLSSLIQFFHQPVNNGNTKMSSLIIVRGLPGSSKSTWVRNNFSKSYLWYEPDHLITDCFGSYRFDAQLWDDVHDLTFRLVDFALARNENVIVSDVFPNRESLMRYIRLSEAHDSNLDIITIKSSVFDSKFKMRNTHGVPLTVLSEMQSNFDYSFGRLIEL
jgi:predicted kinase